MAENAVRAGHGGAAVSADPEPRLVVLGSPANLTNVGLVRGWTERGLDAEVMSAAAALPVLTPGLSSRWLALVTDVDVTTGRNLIDSMGVEVLVNEQRIREVVPGEPLSYAEAVRRALAESGRRCLGRGCRFPRLTGDP